ncbi:zinc-ribbon domain-containing protein [Nocardia sp. NPDC005998]|uniref:zinc-ribbon domain-containing protein n=1 Tax=Nocardia sp. NPDC005998 TaxID=3156894 RepID=UPI0033BB892B
MLIWGWQKRIHTLAMITLVCGNCGNPAAHALRKLVTKFTLFFIPLFPISTKHSLECTWCGASSNVSGDRVNELLAQANSGGMPGQYQQPAPQQPNAQWPQQPNAQWQQPNAQWPQQPTPGTPNADRQQY